MNRPQAEYGTKSGRITEKAREGKIMQDGVRIPEETVLKMLSDGRDERRKTRHMKWHK